MKDDWTKREENIFMYAHTEGYIVYKREEMRNFIKGKFPDLDEKYIDAIDNLFYFGIPGEVVRIPGGMVIQLDKESLNNASL